MTELIDNVNTVTNAQQAVEQYVGEQFIEWLMNFISQEMQTWPIMAKIRSARVKPEKLKKFALQIFLANEAFLGGREGDPGFLRFAIANLSESDDPTAESALEILEKRRMEELSGHRVERGIIKTANRDQWLRLLQALGLTEKEVEDAEPKEATRNYIAELSEVYSTLDWQTAVGAFAGSERALVEEYRAYVELFKNNTTLSDKDLDALTKPLGNSQHVVYTNHILDKIVFDREAKELASQGIFKQLEIRQEFLNGLAKYLEG